MKMLKVQKVLIVPDEQVCVLSMCVEYLCDNL